MSQTEPVEARVARELAARRRCEREMLGKQFTLGEHRYEIRTIDQRYGYGDAHQIPMPHQTSGCQYRLLGVSTDELAGLVGCTCTYHGWVR